MKRILKNIIRNSGYRIERIPRFLTADERTRHYAQKGFNGASFLHGMLFPSLQYKIDRNEKLLILQVGANDGVACDPVFPLARKYVENTQLVLLEPLPDVADRLESNYSFHDNCQVVRKAVSSVEAIRLYRISKSVEKYYQGAMASGIASSSMEYVQRKANQNLPAHIRFRAAFQLVESLEVRCTGISTAIGEYFKGGRIDWLQIDVEGMEEDVLKTLCLAEHQPTLISYEISHLEDDALKRLTFRLESVGYRILSWSKSDSVAVHPRLWESVDLD